MTKKQQARLAKNRESQRLAFLEDVRNGHLCFEHRKPVVANKARINHSNNLLTNHNVR